LPEFTPLLVKPDLEIKVKAVTNDLLTTVRILQHLTPVNSTLAVAKDETGGVREVFIHANIDFDVLRGATDVSSRHRVYRLIQWWDADLDNTNTRVGSYRQGLRKGRASVDTAGTKESIWVDIPGVLIAQNRPTSRQRALAEFWVTVEPTGGALSLSSERIYFIVIIDWTPTDYRVRVSQKVTLIPPLPAAADPQALRSAPYKNELATGPTAITWDHDYGWQPFPPGTVDLMPYPP